MKVSQKILIAILALLVVGSGVYAGVQIHNRNEIDSLSTTESVTANSEYSSESVTDSGDSSSVASTVTETNVSEELTGTQPVASTVIVSNTADSESEVNNSVSYTPSGTVVYITANGKKYHNRSCQYYSDSCVSMDQNEAEANGYSACSICSGQKTYSESTAEETVTITTTSQATTKAWSKSGVTVYIAANGKKYHNKDCRYYNSSSKALDKNEATANGYTPCSICSGSKPGTTKSPTTDAANTTHSNTTNAVTQSKTGTTVYVTPNGKKYHTQSCRYYSSSCTALNINDAEQSGYSACSICSNGSSMVTTKSNTQNTATQSVNNSEGTVYVTASGKKYHRNGCQYLKSVAASYSITEAEQKGYSPCSRCFK